MKKIFLLLSLVLTLNVLSAQHFSIKYIEDGTDYTNGEMTVIENPAVTTLQLKFNIINETSNNMKLGFRKTVVYADEHFDANFCVGDFRNPGDDGYIAGNCYSPNTDTLPESGRPIMSNGEMLVLDADFESYIIVGAFPNPVEYLPVIGSITVIYEFYSDEFDDIATLKITFTNEDNIFTIKNSDGEDYTNGEMIVTENPAVEDLSFELMIYNDTDSPMKVGIRKTIIEASAHFEASFDFEGVSYAPTIMELPEEDRIDIGPMEGYPMIAKFMAVNDELQAVDGSITVKYEIYSDESEAIANLTIIFNNGEKSIISFDKQYETSVYPNPVTDVANFNYQLPEGLANATLNVFSCVGNKLKEMNLPVGENNVSVSVSDLPSGIYIYSINNNGRIIATNKFVVK